jgi:5-methylcytosine-specific restriction endonuclease McrA
MKYICKNCNYESEDKFNYHKHLNTKKHKDKSDNGSIQTNSNEIIKIDNKYKCNHCNNLFTTLESIERHVKLECKYDLRYNDFYVFHDDKLGKNIFKNSENVGDIYIIQTDFSLDNVFKIGITTRLSGRIKEYRTGCNYEPKLYCYFPCKDIYSADKLLKNKLRQYNVKREIYRGNIEDIKRIILDNLKVINNNITFCYKPDVKINNICECTECKKVFFIRSDLVLHNTTCHSISLYHDKSNLIKDFEGRFKQLTMLIQRQNEMIEHKEQILKIKEESHIRQMKTKDDIIDLLKSDNENLKILLDIVYD